MIKKLITSMLAATLIIGPSNHGFCLRISGKAREIAYGGQTGSKYHYAEGLFLNLPSLQTTLNSKFSTLNYSLSLPGLTGQSRVSGVLDKLIGRGNRALTDCRLLTNLRALSHGERSLYTLMKILAEDGRTQAEYDAAIASIRAHPDQGLVAKRLRAWVWYVTKKRTPGNWERLGRYIHETNPEFIERYLPLTQPIFLRRMISDYLRRLNRELNMGMPVAVRARNRLLALAEKIVPDANDERAHSAIKRKLDKLGETGDDFYKSSFISGPPVQNLYNVDRGFQLLGDCIEKSDSEFLQYIKGADGALILRILY